MNKRPRVAEYFEFEEAAQAYLRSLPPEHFMEATPQATQRKITLESLDLVHARRPDVQVLQRAAGAVPPRPAAAIRPGGARQHGGRPRRRRFEAQGSFDVPLQPVGPFWVLEYVSKDNKRKDYDDNFDKYEQELQGAVLPGLLPRQTGADAVPAHGRRLRLGEAKRRRSLCDPELDLEVALLDGWVRYWLRGELLPLPADLLHNLEHIRHLLEQERRVRDRARRGGRSAAGTRLRDSDRCAS